MGWADREDAPTLADMLDAEVRRLEADHADVTHHLDEIRIGEVGDQVAAISASAVDACMTSSSRSRRSTAPDSF